MNKIYATLSADIVDSTSLSAEDTIKLKESLEDFFPVMRQFCEQAWGRVVRGDSVECVIPDVSQSLRIGLLLKCYVRSLDLVSASAILKRKGIRMVIGLGTLRIADQKLGIIDGEAIYNSGRELDAMSASDQVTLSLVSSELHVGGYAALCDVLGYLVDRATNKQCSVLFYLLMGYSQKMIAQTMGLEPSTVSQHAAALGWGAIQRALGWGAIQRALAKFEKENYNQERTVK